MRWYALMKPTKIIVQTHAITKAVTVQANTYDGHKIGTLPELVRLLACGRCGCVVGSWISVGWVHESNLKFCQRIKKISFASARNIFPMWVNMKTQGLSKS